MKNKTNYKNTQMRFSNSTFEFSVNNGRNFIFEELKLIKIK